jgi:thiol-disulfide isomerase/thioredoxin
MNKNNQLEVMYVTPTGKDANENPIDNKYIKTVDDVKRAFDNKKPMFIEFYADWCGHCKTLSELWKDLIGKINKTSNMAIIAVEKDHHNNQHIKNIINKASFKIDGYPTVGAIVFNNDKPSFIHYNRGRTVNGMREFIQQNILSSPQSGGHKHKTNKKHKSSHKKGKKHNRKTIKKHRKTTYRKTKHHRK